MPSNDDRHYCIVDQENQDLRKLVRSHDLNKKMDQAEFVEVLEQRDKYKELFNEWRAKAETPGSKWYKETTRYKEERDEAKKDHTNAVDAMTKWANSHRKLEKERDELAQKLLNKDRDNASLHISHKNLEQDYKAICTQITEAIVERDEARKGQAHYLKEANRLDKIYQQDCGSRHEIKQIRVEYQKTLDALSEERKNYEEYRLNHNDPEIEKLKKELQNVRRYRDGHLDNENYWREEFGKLSKKLAVVQASKPDNDPEIAKLKEELEECDKYWKERYNKLKIETDRFQASMVEARKERGEIQKLFDQVILDENPTWVTESKKLKKERDIEQQDRKIAEADNLRLQIKIQEMEEDLKTWKSSTTRFQDAMVAARGELDIIKKELVGTDWNPSTTAQKGRKFSTMRKLIIVFATGLLAGNLPISDMASATKDFFVGSNVVFTGNYDTIMACNSEGCGATFEPGINVALCNKCGSTGLGMKIAAPLYRNRTFPLPDKQVGIRYKNDDGTTTVVLTDGSIIPE